MLIVLPWVIVMTTLFLCKNSHICIMYVHVAADSLQLIMVTLEEGSFKTHSILCFQISCFKNLELEKYSFKLNGTYNVTHNLLVS